MTPMQLMKGLIDRYEEVKLTCVQVLLLAQILSYYARRFIRRRDGSFQGWSTNPYEIKVIDEMLTLCLILQ